MTMQCNGSVLTLGSTVNLGICAVRASMAADLRLGGSVSDREIPTLTWVNGTLMARHSWLGAERLGSTNLRRSRPHPVPFRSVRDLGCLWLDSCHGQVGPQDHVRADVGMRWWYPRGVFRR